MKLVDKFFATARERYAILQARLDGKDRPWTDDPIFRAWRFCNVHREDDRTTAWFRENLRHLGKNPTHSAILTLIFRWFNRIETGELLKDLLLGKWDTREAKRRLYSVDGPVFTGAYIIRSPFGQPKIDGILGAIDYAIPVLKDNAPHWGVSLEQAWYDLTQLPLMGNFTSYEVVTDLRWSTLDCAVDINTWASPGPGCARGLGWVMEGDPTKYSYTSPKQRVMLNDIMLALLDHSRDELYWPSVYRRWEMREVEHWACEFDKYMRAEKGEKMKRRYP